jgi:thiamine pyrophosphate-dependent acetolactate synthase large subunit-like protein
MGLASSMGLGVALTRPELSVVVFDGDGPSS